MTRLGALTALAVLVTGYAVAQSDTSSTVIVLDIDGAIGPATASYVVRGIERAAEENRALIVLAIDTPGGLDTSMREIIRAILGSPVPVAAYVTPPGARAASAGTYILYASHIAAMAPATNLGAATPISIGGPPSPAPSDAPDAQDDEQDGSERGTPPAPQPATAEERKAVNDAVAYIRSLAEQRGRNADWAELAVRSAASLSAQAALEQNVIDLVASDVPELLARLDGRVVEVAGDTRTLRTAGLAVEHVPPDWRTRLLAVITNPTVAYILMLIGLYGLIFEGYNPGAIVPGVVGAISLLLALFAFNVLPVNYAGLALIALGVVLIIAEFLVTTGVLGIGGVAAFVIGSVILIDTDVPGFGIARPLLIALATTGSAALVGLIWVAMRSRSLPVVSGRQDLERSIATALEDFEHEGNVRVGGELWRARSATPVRAGDTLRIVGVDNLILEVVPRERSD